MMKGGGKEKMKEGERVEEQEETPCILSHRKSLCLPPSCCSAWTWDRLFLCQFIFWFWTLLIETVKTSSFP